MLSSLTALSLSSFYCYCHYLMHCFKTFSFIDVKSDSTEKVKIETKEIDNETERLNEETKKDEAVSEVENKREKTGRNRAGRGRSDQVR